MLFNHKTAGQFGDAFLLCFFCSKTALGRAFLIVLILKHGCMALRLGRRSFLWKLFSGAWS